MRLLVTTPMAIALDASDAAYVRAEDATGAFGILPGHADFITVLAISVISWRDGEGREHHVAVRGGVLTVHGGETVEVATRDGVGEDKLEELGGAVLEHFRSQAAQEEESHFSATKLHLAVIRQLQRYLESGRQAGRPEGSA